ncbi:MAG: ATP synthase F0 subunit B [Pseudomonadota bacterium]
MNKLRAFFSPFLFSALVLFLMTAGPGLAWGSTATTAEGENAPAVSEAGGHGEGGAAAEHGVSDAKFWDFIWRTLNFGVLLVLLVVVLRKPAGQFFANRRESIAQTLKDFEAKKVEADARFRELEFKLSDLAAEHEKILADYTKEGEGEAAKIVAHAHETAERIKKQAEVTIGLEIKAAKDGLTKEIAVMAAAMAEDLIKSNIDEKDQVRLVGEYLDKVVRN